MSPNWKSPSERIPFRRVRFRDFAPRTKSKYGPYHYAWIKPEPISQWRVIKGPKLGHSERGAGNKCIDSYPNELKLSASALPRAFCSCEFFNIRNFCLIGSRNAERLAALLASFGLDLRYYAVEIWHTSRPDRAASSFKSQTGARWASEIERVSRFPVPGHGRNSGQGNVPVKQKILPYNFSFLPPFFPLVVSCTDPKTDKRRKSWIFIPVKRAKIVF